MRDRPDDIYHAFFISFCLITITLSPLLGSLCNHQLSASAYALLYGAGAISNDDEPPTNTM